ncbi:MAG: glycosyltransferase family 4 protein [Egibacteraceae bacterium]
MSLVHFVGHLQRLGVRNTILPLFSRRTSALIPELRALGVNVLDPPDGRLLRHATTIRRLLRTAKPDLVHSTIWEADLASRLAAVCSDTLHVVSLVNTPFVPEAFAAARSPRRLKLFRCIEGFLARHMTDAFHAVTQIAADHAVEHLGIDSARIKVIPRGRDRDLLGEPTPERRARVRGQLGVPLDADVVLNVARHEPPKGLPHLVRAFAKVSAIRPRAVLLVAGREGSATPSLRAEIERLGLNSRVRLLGRRNDVPDLLAAADVFLFSSLWEGIGGAVLEAMAMNVPVVTFAVPGLMEALGGNGLVSPLGDEDGLAAHTLQILEDADRGQALAAIARTHFEERYTIPAVAAQMAQFYRELADSR